VTPYGKICYVDTTAASASEIMAEFAFDATTPFQMNREAANVIYAGIIGDTGRFLYPSTTSKTFALVSKLIQNKTVIVIAHRLSTITDVQQIFFVENGELVSHGKHNELMEDCELYKKMWNAHIGVKDGEIKC